MAKHQAVTLQPGAGGWAGVVQALERKSSAAVWECLFKSTFPSSSPGGHCPGLQCPLEMPRHSPAGWAALSSHQRPAWSLGRTQCRDHMDLCLCVCQGRAVWSFFPLGFTSSHLFHKTPVTKITKLQYLRLKLLLVQGTTREALKAAPE